VLRDLEDEAVALAVDLERVEDLRKLLIELALFSSLDNGLCCWGALERRMQFSQHGLSKGRGKKISQEGKSLPPNDFSA
jgi:hypothetical protein